VAEPGDAPVPYGPENLARYIAGKVALPGVPVVAS
jgi:hypothetical protein